MRLTDYQIQTILRLACQVAGKQARVRVFGSRLDDTANGGVLLPWADNIAYACIYGFVAKGSGHARSDIDLLIIGQLAFEQAIQAITPLEEPLGREISVRLYSPEEFRQKRAAGDNFIRSVLSDARIDLIGAVDDA